MGDFRRITREDLPPGWVAIEGGVDRWFSGEGRPASLDQVFTATFYEDGSLEWYAYLDEGWAADTCAIRLERGKPKGRVSADGVTEYFDNDSYYSVANGHEEGDHADQPKRWEDWVRDGILSIHRAAGYAKERRRRQAAGKPLWQRPDGTFVDD